MIRKIYFALFIAMLLCVGCEFKLKPNDDDNDASHVRIERYDRLESRYLITGDFSALQQMNTEFPIETRTLVEKMLQIGEVSDHDINGASCVSIRILLCRLLSPMRSLSMPIWTT